MRTISFRRILRKRLFIDWLGVHHGEQLRELLVHGEEQVANGRGADHRKRMTNPIYRR
jgi:hypothetical protein